MKKKYTLEITNNENESIDTSWTSNELNLEDALEVLRLMLTNSEEKNLKSIKVNVLTPNKKG